MVITHSYMRYTAIMGTFLGVSVETRSLSRSPSKCDQYDVLFLYLSCASTLLSYGKSSIVNYM